MKKLALPALALLVLLTGCSQGKPDNAADPQIPSLTTAPPAAKPTTPSTTAPNDAGRVRERIDMTDAEKRRLLDPYLTCMRDHGVTVRGTPGKPGVKPMSTEKGNELCSPKLPLPAWEVDKSNPDALDFGRKVVQCLKDKGVKYVELSNSDSQIVGPSLGGPHNDMESINKGLKLIPECQREVAGK